MTRFLVALSVAYLSIILQGCGDEEKATGISCESTTEKLCVAMTRLSKQGSTDDATLEATGGFPLPTNSETLCGQKEAVTKACEKHCSKYETQTEEETTTVAVSNLRMCLGRAIITNNLYMYSKEHCGPYINGVCAPHASWTPAQKAAVELDPTRQDGICGSEATVQQLIAKCEESCSGNHDDFKACVTAAEDEVSQGLQKAIGSGDTAADVTKTPNTNDVNVMATGGDSNALTKEAAKDREEEAADSTEKTAEIADEKRVNDMPQTGDGKEGGTETGVAKTSDTKEGDNKAGEPSEDVESEVTKDSETETADPNDPTSNVLEVTAGSDKTGIYDHEKNRPNIDGLLETNSQVARNMAASKAKGSMAAASVSATGETVSMS